MDTIFTPKNAKIFNCELCDFVCSKISDLNRHNLTSKHQNIAKGVTLDTIFTPKSAKQFECKCGNKYKFRQGLYKHRNKCLYISDKSDTEHCNNQTDIPNKDNMIMMLIKENNDFKNMMMEVMKNGTNAQKVIKRQNKKITRLQMNLDSLSKKYVQLNMQRNRNLSYDETAEGEMKNKYLERLNEKTVKEQQFRGIRRSQPGVGRAFGTLRASHREAPALGPVGLRRRARTRLQPDRPGSARRDPSSVGR